MRPVTHRDSDGPVLMPPEPAPNAKAVYEQLRRAAAEFHERLSPEHAAGVRVLSFGHALVVLQPEVRCLEPGMIRLDGVDESGHPVQVLQHVSQISLGLVAVPRRDQAPRTVRFHD